LTEGTGAIALGSPEGGLPLRAALLAAALLLAASALLAPSPCAQGPAYDLFLKSDYGQALLWVNTRTGDFRWEDKGKKLDVSGRGRLEFPNLGPVVLTFAGSLPGYDWVSLSVKIYGITATGYLAAFPEGTPVRKVVSNFYDRDTRNDRPPEIKTKPKPKKPEVLEINPKPSEVPQGGR
jgi:hypothetical protein